MKTAALCAQLTNAGYLVAGPGTLRVLRAIAEIQAEKGRPAAITEIRDRVGHASTNGVWNAVNRLRAMGLVGSPEGRTDNPANGLFITCRFEPIHD